VLGPEKWKIGVKASILLSLGLMFLILAGSTWDYSNSSKFCATCHTMEFVTSSYSTSPHAEVSCTSCHLGVGFAPVMLFKKATEVNQVVKNVTGTYDKPIRIRNEIHVDKSCERCHYTKVFYDQRLKVNHSFALDEENTPIKSVMLFNTGGGPKAWGIHWHVENRIVYGKDGEGKIVHIELETADGEQGIYTRLNSSQPVAFKQMDCVDCHNRVAHRIFNPEKVVDEYLSNEKLPPLPYIKRELTGMLAEAKDQPPEIWGQEFTKISDYYRQNYPQVYNESKDVINQLPQLLQEMASQILFPEMKVTWETYRDSLSHEGCFKCHNTEFQLETAKSSSGLPQAIRMDCQICHSMPVTAKGEGQTITIQLK